MTPTNGVTSVADYFRRAEMSGRWRLGGLPPQDLPLPERLMAGISQRPIHCRGASRVPRPEAEGLAQRQHRGPESLLKGATRASLTHARRASGATGKLLKRSTHYGDSRTSRVPVRNDPVKHKPYGRGCGVPRGRGVGVVLPPGVGVAVADAVGVAVAVGVGVGEALAQGLTGQLKISIEAIMARPLS